MYRGKMTCVPVGVTGDAADRSTIYDQYDAAVSNAWRDGGRRKKQEFDPQGREAGSEVIEEDDDDDDRFMSGAVEEVVNQTQTGTERIIRRDVPDAQDRLQRERASGNQIAEQQEQREQVMDAAYSDYDSELTEAWRQK